MSRSMRRRLTGRVVSSKMQKTVVVMVETTTRHPVYGKTMRARKRYKAHDGASSCGVGDLVRIVESRPISKQKAWVVEEVLERRKGA
ncbi:MAG: 30S ribosomal protein S17 [Bacillota bacterium]|nr:30S ribosomal protein S17 [Bacillota bacterium]